MRLIRLLPLLLIVLLLLLIFQRLLFTDLILARGDTYSYFYPYWDVRGEAFRAGQIPLWTNDIFMGVPLLANPQIGTFYPLNWLLSGLRAPDAVRISIVLHGLIAACGMYALCRQMVADSRPAALCAALIFAFGGTLGAHVEQINQLQGLALLPWLLLTFERVLRAPRPFVWCVLLALLWALQIFTGHTQTVFTSGVGLGVWALGSGALSAHRLRGMVRALLLLAVTALATLLFALPQLLPTLELTGMSNRGGGFSAQQATAFSLPPLYLPRALLPGYDGLLFGEYVAYSGVIALGLALFAVWIALRGQDASARSARVWVLLAVTGLLLAFGRFNPLYWMLAELPGFDLFRVPARWMALVAVALALLAGLGVARLQAQHISRRLIAAVMLLMLGWIGAARVLPVQQEDIIGAAVPGLLAVGLWLAALVALLLLFVLPWHRLRAGAALLLVALELVAASGSMPYNDLAPREVYLGQRFTISQMLAYQQAESSAGRMLAISQLYFDPGDLATLQARYARYGLDDAALHTAFTAIKKQEMLFPNLGMTWHLPTIDGFEGGILPTLYYSQLTSLLLPHDSPRTLDGRLGEMLARADCRGACIPDERWLELTATRYIITDKVYDVWQHGVAYDTALPLRLNAAESVRLDALLPDFYGTELRVLFTMPASGDQPVARLQLTSADGASVQADLLPQNLRVDGMLLATVAVPGNPAAIEIAAQQALTIHAMTLVDTRSGDFVQIPLRYPRILSSDIKIYERPGVERALLAQQVTLLPDNWQGHEDALIAMRDPAFDPAQAVVIHGENLPLTGGTGQVTLLTDGVTDLELLVQADADSWLILRDAWYPGWKATINDQPAPIYRANVMFRALRVPAGESRVRFSFQPDMWFAAIMVGAGCWLLALLSLALAVRRKPASPAGILSPAHDAS